MRPEIHDLIEAARALGIVRTDRPTPHCVRLAGDPQSFPERLSDLQEKLEAVDASGSLADDDGPEAPGETERLRKALDGLLRFIQIKGVDLDSAVDIVSEALELPQKTEKKQKAYTTLPRFAPNGWKRKKTLNPRLHLMPDLPGDQGVADLRNIAFAVNMTAGWMGGAFPKESKHLAKQIDDLVNEGKNVPAAPSM